MRARWGRGSIHACGATCLPGACSPVIACRGRRCLLRPLLHVCVHLSGFSGHGSGPLEAPALASGPFGCGPHHASEGAGVGAVPPQLPAVTQSPASLVLRREHAAAPASCSRPKTRAWGTHRTMTSRCHSRATLRAPSTALMAKLVLNCPAPHLGRGSCEQSEGC